MGLSLLGIVWVQAHWINNSIEIKEKQFDQLVNTSLNEIVSSLDNNESMMFIEEHLPEEAKNIFIGLGGDTKNIVWEHENDSVSFTSIDSSSDKDIRVSVEAYADESCGKEKHTITKTKKVIVNNKVVTEDITTEEVLGKRFDDVMIKMVKEFKRRDNPVQHLLKDTNLDSLIKTTLSNNGIELIANHIVAQNDSIIEQYSSTKKLSEPEYTTPLFKHDLKSSPTSLSLSFEDKSMYVLKSMWLMLLFSGVFTLVILGSFIGALYFILKQKKISEIKNDFINNMTHEFKTPIATISLAIDSITHPEIIKNNEQIRYYADIVKKENERMNKQVESVLNTSLAEKNELGLTLSEINVEELILRAAQRAELTLKAKNGSLKVSHKGEPINMKGDFEHLENIVCNLIDNAIKYNENTPEIEINYLTENNFFILIISDNGIGMDKETQANIFKKFYRAQTGNIHNTKGFGIGLSYVQAIVKAHNGNIDLKSQPGKGSAFEIKLPLQHE